MGILAAIKTAGVVATQLLPFGIDLAEGWQERKKQEAEAAHERKIEAMRTGQHDYKDDVVLVLAAYPIVSAFIPQLRANTLEAIEQLQDYPEWMTGLWVTIALLVYGAQKLTKAKR